MAFWASGLVNRVLITSSFSVISFWACSNLFFRSSKSALNYLFSVLSSESCATSTLFKSSIVLALSSSRLAWLNLNSPDVFCCWVYSRTAWSSILAPFCFSASASDAASFNSRAEYRASIAVCLPRTAAFFSSSKLFSSYLFFSVNASIWSDSIFLVS